MDTSSVRVSLISIRMEGCQHLPLSVDHTGELEEKPESLWRIYLEGKSLRKRFLCLLLKTSFFPDVGFNEPDEQSIIMYVSQFLEHFPGLEEVRSLQV